MKNQRLRYRSVVVTIQNGKILQNILWHHIPKLKRITMQLEDKDTEGHETNQTHVQAFLEFTDYVYKSSLMKALPSVHIPTLQELQELKRKYPNGMKPEQGRFYCSNPVKRVKDTPVMIFEDGKWVAGYDFFEFLTSHDLHNDMTPPDHGDHPKPSFYILVKGKPEEVIEIGSVRLRQLGEWCNLGQECSTCAHQDFERLRQLEKLREKRL